MIQVLDENRKRTAGENFSQAIGGLINQGSQFMQQNQAQERQKQRNSQLSQLLGYDVSQLPENMQMEALKNKFASQLQGEKFGFESEEAANKLRGQEQEKETSKKITQGAFDRIAQLIPHVGKGSGILGMFGGKQAEHTGEFSSLTGALESHLVDLVNKGTLSNTRFKYITETLLPKPTDTQDEIKGKMKGLAQILDLDSSVLGTGPISKKNKRPLNIFER